MTSFRNGTFRLEVQPGRVEFARHTRQRNPSPQVMCRVIGVREGRADEARQKLIAFLNKDLGTTDIAVAQTYMEDSLRLVLHLMPNGPTHPSSGAHPTLFRGPPSTRLPEPGDDAARRVHSRACPEYSPAHASSGGGGLEGGDVCG